MKDNRELCGDLCQDETASGPEDVKATPLQGYLAHIKKTPPLGLESRVETK